MSQSTRLFWLVVSVSLILTGLFVQIAVHVAPDPNLYAGIAVCLTFPAVVWLIAPVGLRLFASYQTAYVYRSMTGPDLLELIEAACYFLADVLTWPWRARRFFREAFGVRPEDADQALINERLGLLAGSMEMAFESQIRYQARWEKLPLEQRTAIKALVQRTKDEFWRAHGAARRFGFNVETSRKYYLRWEWPQRAATTA